MLKRLIFSIVINMAALNSAWADRVGTVGLSQFPERTGDDIYHAVCISCHMPEGAGAVGAASYPFLNSQNVDLVSSAYIAHVVMYGRDGMPALGGVLDDEQIAAITNYIRTSFGNNYQTGAITPEDVSSMRIPGFIYNDLN